MIRLKPWQVSGAAWLASKRFALLADEMRVGKTRTAIEAARLVGAKRILVLCPAIARANWAAEFGGSVRVIETHAERIWPPVASETVVASYDLIPGCDTGDWDVLILDESHYLRTPATIRAKAVLGRAGIVRRARRVWALSGTPMVNHAAELWTLLRTFGAYREDYETFVREFCTGFMGPYGFRITGTKNHVRLCDLLEPVMLRRTLQGVAPELDPIEYSTYALPGHFRPPADAELAVTLALHQEDPVAALATAGPSAATLRRLAGEAKAPLAVELLRGELEADEHKVVVFAVHRGVIAELAEGLSAVRPVVVNGEVSGAARDKAVHRFRTDPKCRVFIGNIQAAGTAIDLSVADEVVFVESSWVPGDNKQAAMRLQNMNRTTPVTARFLSLAGTIDARIQSVIVRKTQDFDLLFGAKGV
jgi:SNF2 family DNA or RNA helicase